MRKAIFVILLTLFFMRASSAAPCYGTNLPGQKKFSVGVEAYSIFQRYLEREFGEVRSSQYFLLLSYGVTDWFSIDLKGGAGNIKQRPRSSDEIEYESSFAGGYGYRLKFFDAHNYKAVFGFQHISVHPKSTRLGSIRHKAILDDWQYSLLLSRGFPKITPYLGTRWSRVDYIHNNDGERKRAMSDLTKQIGLVVGCDIPFAQKMRINLEGQFLDCTAGAVSVNYVF